MSFLKINSFFPLFILFCSIFNHFYHIKRKKYAVDQIKYKENKIFTLIEILENRIKKLGCNFDAVFVGKVTNTSGDHIPRLSLSVLAVSHINWNRKVVHFYHFAIIMK